MDVVFNSRDSYGYLIMNNDSGYVSNNIDQESNSDSVTESLNNSSVEILKSLLPKSIYISEDALLERPDLDKTFDAATEEQITEFAGLNYDPVSRYNLSDSGSSACSVVVPIPAPIYYDLNNTDSVTPLLNEYNSISSNPSDGPFFGFENVPMQSSNCALRNGVNLCTNDFLLTDDKLGSSFLGFFTNRQKCEDVSKVDDGTLITDLDNTWENQKLPKVIESSETKTRISEIKETASEIEETAFETKETAFETNESAFEIKETAFDIKETACETEQTVFEIKETAFAIAETDDEKKEFAFEIKEIPSEIKKGEYETISSIENLLDSTVHNTSVNESSSVNLENSFINIEELPVFIGEIPIISENATVSVSTLSQEENEELVTLIIENPSNSTAETSNNTVEMLRIENVSNKSESTSKKVLTNIDLTNSTNKCKDDINQAGPSKISIPRRNSIKNKENVKDPEVFKTPSKTLKRKFSEIGSPDLFSDDEFTKTKPVPSPKIVEEKFVHKLDHRLVKRVQRCISGLPPPPDLTITKLTVDDIVERLKTNRSYFWTKENLEEAKKENEEKEKEAHSKSLNSSFGPMGSILIEGQLEEAVNKEFPDILYSRHHGLQ